MSNLIELRNATAFGAIASEYAASRPRYPDALFDWMQSIAPGQRLAWDAGCGSGQATAGLAPRFEQVIGSDSSAEQTAMAPAFGNVSFVVAAAEATPLVEASVDLAIAANAFHWFNLEAFFSTLLKALAPRGVFVALGYGSSVIPALGDRVAQAYRFLDPYWADGNRALWGGYRDIIFPLDAIEAPPFSIELEWTLDQWLAYSATWSAYRRYVTEAGQDPLHQIRSALQPYWGNGSQSVSMPLILKAGRKPE